MIELNNITKSYLTEEVETLALRNLSLKIDEGDFLAIMGPSGCGKSTLLNIIGLLDKPDSGSYTFKGQSMENLSFKQMAEVRKYNIGFVFQNFNLIEELSVYDNVALPLLYQNVSKSESRSRVENILTQLDIIHRKKHFPPQLSGGQQQRVAVARALVNKPNVILADEPTGNLDSKNGDDVMRLLQELNNNGTTIIMVTHSEHDAKYSKQIVRLMDGKVIESENSKTVAI